MINNLTDIKIALEDLSEKRGKLLRDKKFFEEKINNTKSLKDDIEKQIDKIENELKNKFPHAILLPEIIGITEEEFTYDSLTWYKYKNIEGKNCIKKIAYKQINMFESHILRLRERIIEINNNIKKINDIESEYVLKKDTAIFYKKKTKKIIDEILIQIMVDLYLEVYPKKPTLKKISNRAKKTLENCSGSSISRRLNQQFFLAILMKEIEKRRKSNYNKSEETFYKLTQLLENVKLSIINLKKKIELIKI